MDVHIFNLELGHQHNRVDELLWFSSAPMLFPIDLWVTDHSIGISAAFKCSLDNSKLVSECTTEVPWPEDHINEKPLKKSKEITVVVIFYSVKYTIYFTKIYSHTSIIL